MTTRNEDPQEMVKVGGAAPPNWLAPYMEEDKSREGMEEYRILPWLKVVQGNTENAMKLKQEFGEGSVIISPGNMLVCKAGESFLFVPCFFFVEFCKWSDRDDGENLPVVQRTFDPASDLARRARSQEDRLEGYGGTAEVASKAKAGGQKYEYRYVEHLNFAGYIYGDNPLRGASVTLSFQRGEFMVGKGFISLCEMRGTPLWSQVWQFTPGTRTAGQNSWWGLDAKAPEGRVKLEDGTDVSHTILQEEAPIFMKHHEDFKSAKEKEKLRVDREGEEDTQQSGDMETPF